MNHAISNAGSLEANHYAAIDRDERKSRAFDLRCDQVRNDMTWSEIEDAMSEAPAAQRKEFWSQMLQFIDTDARFIGRQNVSLIAGPLQEAVALAIDEQVKKEFAP
jgi:Ca2+-binding EF-hand superfamily protein